jgi:hypothetical protein
MFSILTPLHPGARKVQVRKSWNKTLTIAAMVVIPVAVVAVVWKTVAK